MQHFTHSAMIAVQEAFGFLTMTRANVAATRTLKLKTTKTTKTTKTAV